MREFDGLLAVNAVQRQASETFSDSGINGWRGGGGKEHGEHHTTTTLTLRC